MYVFEPARGGFGQGEPGVDESVENGDLGEGPVAQVTEAVEHNPHGDEFEEADGEGADDEHQEGGSVLHLASHRHRDQAAIEGDTIAEAGQHVFSPHPPWATRTRRPWAIMARPSRMRTPDQAS